MAYLDNRTADSVRRQAQRELEQERALQDQLQQALELKDHYFGNRQVGSGQKMIVHCIFYWSARSRSVSIVRLSSIHRVYFSNARICLVMI